MELLFGGFCLFVVDSHAAYKTTHKILCVTLLWKTLIVHLREIVNAFLGWGKSCLALSWTIWDLWNFVWWWPPLSFTNNNSNLRIVMCPFSQELSALQVFMTRTKYMCYKTIQLSICCNLLITCMHTYTHTHTHTYQYYVEKKWVLSADWETLMSFERMFQFQRVFHLD